MRRCRPRPRVPWLCEPTSSSSKGRRRRAGAGLVRSEPDGDLFAVDGVVLRKRGERHQAAMLRIEPALPVRAVHVADVGGAAVRLHPEQFLKINRLALGFASWWRPSAPAASSASRVPGPGSVRASVRFRSHPLTITQNSASSRSPQGARSAACRCRSATAARRRPKPPPGRTIGRRRPSGFRRSGRSADRRRAARAG
jgi:hypothetical protein